MRRVPYSLNNRGFSLIELMTVLVIAAILTAVSLPTYRAYVNNATLAEAVTVLGTMELNQIKYFAENGSFISAAPNPAAVPGISDSNPSGSFGTSSQWAALGFPVTPGTQVLFSYQAFAGQTEKTSTTPIINDNLFNPNDDLDLQRTGRYTASIQEVPMKNYALHAKDFELDFGFGSCAFAASDAYAACIAACRGNGRCESECSDAEADAYDPVSACNTGCVEAHGEAATGGCSARCDRPSDGSCSSSAADIDCYSGSSAQSCVVACRGNAVCIKNCSGGNVEPSVCTALVIEGKSCSGSGNILGGGGGGGGGEEEVVEDGGDAPQDEGEEESEEEGEDGVGGGGDAGGMLTDGEDDEDGETTIAENTCASFGVSRPVHFGVQEGLADYSWVVNTSVTNRNKNSSDCWLVVRVIQVINGNTSITAPIQINSGE